VTELFRAHHVELVRLALIMVGDLATAEDVVQDAFDRIARSWGGLRKQSSGVAYVRSCVLNGCRSVHRREVLVLRYYADLDVAEIADTLKITTSAVRASNSRGLATLARALGED
jgi:DNA-directed RNA polymerase specialized sigma24 family protein